MIDLDMQTEYKTKDRDYRYFVRECEYYQKELGLLNWKIYYDHILNGKNKDSLAWTNGDNGGMVATIVLAVEWKYTKPTEYQLSRVAFHEMCELLTWKIDEMARIGCSAERCNEERHGIIMTLENILFPVLYKKRQRRRK
jgi:hypothetical protein